MVNPKRAIAAIYTLLWAASFFAASLLPTSADAQASNRSPHAPGEIHTQEHVDKSGLQDVARQSNNPLSTLWTLQNQFDFRTIDDIPTVGGGSRDDQFQFSWGFQPVLPLHLTKRVNLINRAVLPFIDVNPVPSASGGITRSAEFGDIVLANIVAPNKAKGFIYGLGPTWIFPSASSDTAGAGRWSVGPAAAAFYVGEEWIFGVFPQQWFSIAGDADRESVSQLDAKYFLWRLFPGGWQVGFSQDLLVDWKASSGNKVTFPIGLGVGKVLRLGKMPIKATGQVGYAVVSPDVAGQRVDFQLQITPVIGALCCKGTIF